VRYTDYCRRRLAQRPEIREIDIAFVCFAFLRRDIQPDGRIRLWGYIAGAGKHLRVVLLPDGTVHNAFFDRGFKP
jgi:hypothetical protein